MPGRHATLHLGRLEAAPVCAAQVSLVVYDLAESNSWYAEDHL